MGVQELLPPDLPLIIDSKHGDLNSASVMAAYVFRSLQADAVTLMPLAGQDITAPFPMYQGKGVVIHCHRSNPAAGVIHDHPAQDNPLFVQVVRVSQGLGDARSDVDGSGSGPPTSPQAGVPNGVIGLSESN